VAVDHVNLTVSGGEFVAVTGPSGSGKSTLLNLVAALDRPDGGRVVVGGLDLGTADAKALAGYRRDTVGVVFQDSILVPELSVRANVAVPAMLAGGGRADVTERVGVLLERLELGALGDRLPHQLSGGQRQRVAVARAMINSPGLIVADEPTGSLDTAQGLLVVDMLSAAHVAGATVFLITHDPRVAAVAGREVHIVDGKIIE
jgi:putative ABC transport system ATP-binding protein